MGTGTTDWLPGIVALAVGLLAGIALALRSRRSAAAPLPAEAPQLRDLAAERELLVSRLREMGDGTDPATARERYRLELEAARVLLGLERERPALPAAPVAAASAPAALAARSPAVPFLWGVVATSMVFGLVLWVMSQAKERPEGGSMTGNAQVAAGPMDAGGGDAPAQPDPELDELKAFADQHPDSVDAQLDLAQAQVQRDQLVGAFESAQKVLQKDPENARAQTYSAVVRSAMGQVDQALATLDDVVKRKPDLTEAWVYRGLVAADAGRYTVAIESWETALKLRPDGASVISGPLERVRQLAKEQASGTGAFAAGPVPADHPGVKGSLPPGHPSLGAAAPAPAVAAAPAPAAAPAAGGVTGTITLAAGARIVPGSLIFVSVRPDGQTGGPPVAAKRLPPGPFPMQFSIGPQDSMMGLPWPDRAQVEVRLDSDGNAMSRDPADPSAKATGVVTGARLDLVLAVQ
jgi:tetratricopeptide (TPR) repeat protein